MNDLIFERCCRERGINDQRFRCVRLVYELIEKRDDVKGILWGGSLSWRTADAYSDCDLFCHVVGNLETVFQEMLSVIKARQAVRLVMDQGNWPWFGRTMTVFFNEDDLFSVDVGLIADIQANNFFWEPNGVIIRDKTGIIRSSIEQTIASGNLNPYGPREPFKNLVLLLFKVRKNIARGNLWNAFEYVNQTRRYLMLMLRHIYAIDDFYLGRPDRDINAVLPAEVLDRLSHSVPGVSAEEIGTATVRIAEWCCEIGIRHPWDLCDVYVAEIRRLCAAISELVEEK